METGHKVKKIRELRNLTQEYMANRLGITQESYSKMESNRNNISINKLERIAQILEVKVEDLLNFDEKKVLFNIGDNSCQQNNQVIFYAEGEAIKDLYEKIITQQKEEIEFLRELVKELKK